LCSNEALRRTMGERGRSVAVSRYAWPQVVAQHLPVYASVAQRRGGT
jgi:hypothetical protein